MVAPSRKLDPVIRQIHSSVGNDAGWGEVVDRVRTLLRGRAATLARHDFFNGRGQQLFGSPPNPALWTAYAREHAVGDPWFMSSMDFRAGRVMTGDELLAHSDLIRTDFYQRFLKPHRLAHWLCGVAARSDQIIHYLAVYRSRSQPAFSEEDKRLGKLILDHLTISLQNHWVLLSERSTNTILGDVANHLAQAVFIVDPEGVVLLGNTGSEDFLNRCETLDIVDSRLTAKSQRENNVLSLAIAEVATRKTTGNTGGATVVTINGASPARPIMISMRPAGKFFCSRAREYRDAAIVSAKDPEKFEHSQVCAFSKLYQLTPAQARLTGLILSGHTRADAARRLQVSENTVRSHLKQIFLKTDTHGQMDLVQLHAKICADHY